MRCSAGEGGVAGRGGQFPSRAHVSYRTRRTNSNATFLMYVLRVICRCLEATRALAICGRRRGAAAVRRSPRRARCRLVQSPAAAYLHRPVFSQTPGADAAHQKRVLFAFARPRRRHSTRSHWGPSRPRPALGRFRLPATPTRPTPPPFLREAARLTPSHPPVHAQNVIMSPLLPPRRTCLIVRPDLSTPHRRCANLIPFVHTHPQPQYA
ncbi:hypothetical protein C2E23DRAFT_223162 [Lenzites betulinus]|nr:hypothetical protein C2E23DRAFT_223162 [Lenzites betulinus]